MKIGIPKIKQPKISKIKKPSIPKIKKITMPGVRFGYGYSIADVARQVEEEIEDAPYYRLKDIAEELELDLKVGFVGF